MHASVLAEAFGLDERGASQLPGGVAPSCSFSRHWRRQMSLARAKKVRALAVAIWHFASSTCRPSPLLESSQ
jgi:hypothetical protein